MSTSVSVHFEVQRLSSVPTGDRKGFNKELPSVRRCLFGPVDHSESQRFFDSEMKKLERNQSQKWEFDFRNEKPFVNASRYEWCKVACPGLVRKKKGARGHDDEEEAENNEHLYYTDDLDDVVVGRRKREIDCESIVNVKAFTKQNLITDYMPVKKRASSSLVVKKLSEEQPSKLARTVQKDVAS